jgi:hypothetical protein
VRAAEGEIAARGLLDVLADDLQRVREIAERVADRDHR